MTAHRDGWVGRVVRADQVSDDERERWQDLVDRALEPNPFAGPAFVVPFAELLGPPSGVYVVAMERDGCWMGVLVLSGPLPRWHRSPFRFVTTDVGRITEFLPLLGPIVDAVDADDALVALFQFVGSRSSGLPGLLELTSAIGDGPMGAKLVAALERLGLPWVPLWEYHRAVVHAGDGLDAWRSRIGGVTRRRLSKTRRYLADALGAEPIVMNVTADPSFAVEFAHFQAEGWKGDPSRGGKGFSLDPAKAEWLRRVVDALRDRDELWATRLTANTEVLHMAFAVRSGRAWFTLADAYNEHWGRWSPGVYGRSLLVEQLLELRDVDLIDSCTHPSRTGGQHLYPESRRLAAMLVATHGVGQKAFVLAIPRIRAARDNWRTRCGPRKE